MYKLLSVFLLTTVMFINILVPSIGWATTTQTQDSKIFLVKYLAGEGYATYTITIFNHFTVDFNLSNNIYNNTKQSIGGVIYNAKRSGYYPFGQTVSSAWSKYYKFSTYNSQFSFSVDPGPFLYDPNDKPYGFLYAARSFYPGDRLDPYFKWAGYGTIPYEKTLQTKSIYF